MSPLFRMVRREVVFSCDAPADKYFSFTDHLSFSNTFQPSPAPAAQSNLLFPALLRLGSSHVRAHPANLFLMVQAPAGLQDEDAASSLLHPQVQGIHAPDSLACHRSVTAAFQFVLSSRPAKALHRTKAQPAVRTRTCTVSLGQNQNTPKARRCPGENRQPASHLLHPGPGNSPCS